jgi:nucleoside phosphorylase
MCGVCAGNPSDVSLGDVIVAEITYIYDEGKRVTDGFEPDHRQIPAHDNAWLRELQDLRADGLPSHGPATKEDATAWLLERLYVGGIPPGKHPARARYFPERTWGRRIKQLETEGLIRRTGPDLELTLQGRERAIASRVYDLDPPRKLPFAIKVGPMASGNAVVKDGRTWDDLKRFGVRTVVGLEMEAAHLAMMAYLARTPWIVAKGVMDYADPAKDDRYKPFAARASAEVLFKFLASKFVTRLPSELREPPLGRVTQAEADYLAMRSFIAVIKALFDAEYYIPGSSHELEFYQLTWVIADEVLDKVRSDLDTSASLEQLAHKLVTEGLINEALIRLVKKVRDDWDRLRPYAKLALLELAKRYPSAGLDNLPALTAAELEIAGIKWFVADSIFQNEWNAYIVEMAASGFDIPDRRVRWNDMAAEVKYYCEKFESLIRSRISADVALVQLSTSRTNLQSARGYIAERASVTYGKVIDAVNAICLSYPNPGKAMELFSKPMQTAAARLLDNPLAVVPSHEWRLRLKGGLDGA